MSTRTQTLHARRDPTTAVLLAHSITSMTMRYGSAVNEAALAPVGSAAAERWQRISERRYKAIGRLANALRDLAVR